MTESLDLALKLLGYFDNHNLPYPRQEFVDGADCVREWIALIEEDSPAPDRVDNFAERIANYSDDAGSAWIELQWAVNRWVDNFRRAPSG